MMTPRLPLLSIVAAAAALAACGDLSQEDLLFAAAVPKKADIEVRPAGVASQAQTSTSQVRQTLEVDNCEDGDLRCMAEGVSGGLNALSFGLLDIVDAITNEPPTTRSRGRRVWGPFFDRDEGSTFRFEMVREDDGSFTFCAHAKSGDLEERNARDITCATDFDTDSEMALILDGNFRPGQIAGERARTGSGVLTLQLSRVDGNLRGIGTELEISFDNTDERTNIDMIIRDVPIGNGELDDANYNYLRNADDSGEFYFAARFNIHKPDENLPQAERFEIGTRWVADQSGIGRARVSDGDLGADTAEMIQCWGAEGALTYLDVNPDELFDVPVELTDPNVCVFDPATEAPRFPDE